MIGAVRLRVADRDALVDYYTKAIGLRELDRDQDVTRLGTDTALLELVHDPDAPPAPPRSTGLFHFAILVPSRPDLAAAVRRVVQAGERFTGASDHFVSEALYLRDPEGNGIEIYRDRPRTEWEHEPSGELRMGTVALDLDSVMAEMPGEDGTTMPDGTIMGHVHLQVADLEPIERFYAGDLGLDVMVRSYPGALFLARDGYHHHVGTNTWASAGAPAPPEGSRGLEWFELRTGGDGFVTDPSGNRIRLLAD